MAGDIGAFPVGTPALDSGNLSLAAGTLGAGRARQNLNRYLGNNAIANVLDFAPDGVNLVDGVTDAAPYVQAAINFAALTGRRVWAPSGTYLIGATLTVPSFVTIIGDGKGVTIFREHAALGARRIMSATGTAGARLRNIVLRDLTIRNGTASAGNYTAGMNGFRADYVDFLTFNRVEITEIQGTDGIAIRNCTHVVAKGSRFYRCTYSMFSCLTDCDGVTVQFCEFDTLTSLTAANVYTFASGYEDALGTAFAKNVRILDNTFLNNPRWEGIDFHGGENIWVKRNRVDTCNVGLLLACANTAVAAPLLRNVWVRDNVFVQGVGTAGDGIGVIINGSDDHTVRATNIHVTGNKFVGFGGDTVTTGAAVVALVATGVNIERNEFEDWKYCAVMTVNDVRTSRIVGNLFGNCANPTFNASCAAIHMRSGGVYGQLVADNELRPTDATKIPAYFYRAATSYLSVQFRNNTVEQVSVATYGNIGFLPVEKSAIPTTLLSLKYGDAVYTDTGKLGWNVSKIGAVGKLGYGSFDTASVQCTASIGVGAKTLTTLGAFALDYSAFPEGMNISIAGAGAAGAALLARVVKNNVTSIDIDTAASTAVVGANVTYQGLTLV